MSDAGHDQIGCGVCGDEEGHDGPCPPYFKMKAERDTLRGLLHGWLAAYGNEMQRDGYPDSHAEIARLFAYIADRSRRALGADIAAPEPVKPATCETCKGSKQILQFYNRGPGDPPGNHMVACPMCQDV